MSLAVVILAAGQGTRMLSKRQKILHDVGGMPMVAHVFEAAASIASRRPLLVVAPGESGVQNLFGDRAEYVLQPERLGTGHAALMAKPLLEGAADQVLLTYGDMPLLRAGTMARLAERQAENGAAVVMLSATGDPASTFGRVVRDDRGRVVEIVEVAEARQRDHAEALLAITELNVGVYCFAANWLWRNISHLPLRQARSGQEYYLTDMVGLAVAQGLPVEAEKVTDPDECLGAGTRAELAVVETAFRRRARDYWLAHGVTLVDPETIYIDQTVTIGQDTIIWPNTYLQGETTIGQDCVLGPNTILRHAQIGDGCVIEQAVIEQTSIPSGTSVAPFSHLSGEELSG